MGKWGIGAGLLLAYSSVYWSDRAVLSQNHTLVNSNFDVNIDFTWAHQMLLQ